jgi:hypothetical protein
MDQSQLIVVLTVFVFVAMVAMCVQAFFLFGIYKAAREFQQKAVPLVPKVDALVESSRVAIDDSRHQINAITEKASDILDVTRKQLARVDEVLADASDRARVQFDRAEMVLDDAMIRTQETVALVHTGIMKPLREIQGVTAGVKAALNFLMRGRQNGPVHATADEEMFI